jgi:hypothetical protein
MKTLFFALVMICVSANAFAFGEDMTEKEWAKYEKQCPWLDAVVTDSTESRASSVPVDCINWNSKRQMWEAWYMDEHDLKVTVFFGQDKKVFSAKGKLSVKNNRVTATPYDEYKVQQEAEEKVKQMFDSPILK